jgi:hypothetical protein
MKKLLLTAATLMVASTTAYAERCSSTGASFVYESALAYMCYGSFSSKDAHTVWTSEGWSSWPGPLITAVPLPPVRPFEAVVVAVPKEKQKHAMRTRRPLLLRATH